MTSTLSWLKKVVTGSFDTTRNVSRSTQRNPPVTKRRGASLSNDMVKKPYLRRPRPWRLEAAVGGVPDPARPPDQLGILIIFVTRDDYAILYIVRPRVLRQHHPAQDPRTLDRSESLRVWTAPRGARDCRE